MTIWRTCIACRIPKATNTHSECVILIAFPLQLWLHESASVLRYTYTACLGLFSEGPRPVLGPNQLPIQCTSKAFFPGVMRSARQAVHSHPPSTEIRNAWSNTFTPPQLEEQENIFWMKFKLSEYKISGTKVAVECTAVLLQIRDFQNSNFNPGTGHFDFFFFLLPLISFQFIIFNSSCNMALLDY